MSAAIAVITPSFERDFELCKTLNRSVLEFLPESVNHYILVDRRDYRLFSALANRRTVVMRKEEVMPRGIVHLPMSNRWFSQATLVPLSGWLVQQIAKIAAANVLDEPTLVNVDSDALFVRDVDPSLFVTADGSSRLYRCPNGITAEMADHVRWYRNACTLLNVPAGEPPFDDYIGQIISWDRQTVKSMCARIESVSGRAWHRTLAQTRAVSEYLLYGLFVDRVLGPSGNVWIDENSRCRMHWEFKPLQRDDIPAFSTSLNAEDIALMISSHSGTALDVRSAAVALATNGRVS